MSTKLPFDLDGEMMAAIYPKKSYPVLSFGYNFSFVLNMSRLIDHETFILAPSHELRRANEAEIAADGYPVDSPSPNMLCFRYEFDTGLDNSVVCDRFDGHGLLC